VIEELLDSMGTKDRVATTTIATTTITATMRTQSFVLRFLGGVDSSAWEYEALGTGAGSTGEDVVWGAGTESSG
jgi:hypothetical protein